MKKYTKQTASLLSKLTNRSVSKTNSDETNLPSLSLSSDMNLSVEGINDALKRFIYNEYVDMMKVHDIEARPYDEVMRYFDKEYDSEDKTIFLKLTYANFYNLVCFVSDIDTSTMEFTIGNMAREYMLYRSTIYGIKVRGYDKLYVVDKEYKIDELIGELTYNGKAIERDDLIITKLMPLELMR